MLPETRRSIPVSIRTEAAPENSPLGRPESRSTAPPVALRRLDFKIELGFLSVGQVRSAFSLFLDLEPLVELFGAATLTPSDFAECSAAGGGVRLPSEPRHSGRDAPRGV